MIKILRFRKRANESEYSIFLTKTITKINFVDTCELIFHPFTRKSEDRRSFLESIQNLKRVLQDSIIGEITQKL